MLLNFEIYSNMYFRKFIRNQDWSFVAGVSFPPLVVVPVLTENVRKQAFSSLSLHKKLQSVRFSSRANVERDESSLVSRLGSATVGSDKVVPKKRSFTLQLTKTVVESLPGKNKRNLATKAQTNKEFLALTVPHG